MDDTDIAKNICDTVGKINIKQVSYLLAIFIPVAVYTAYWYLAIYMLNIDFYRSAPLHIVIVASFLLSMPHIAVSLLYTLRFVLKNGGDNALIIAVSIYYLVIILIGLCCLLFAFHYIQLSIFWLILASALVLLPMGKAVIIMVQLHFSK